MPATEETYRSQPTLHLVFAISSIAMLLVDRLDGHGRPPPPLEASPARVPAGRAREARGGRARRSWRSRRRSTRRRSTRSTPKIKEAEADAEARAPRSAPARQRARQVLERQGPRSSTPQRRFKKAELDSKRSLYDGMIDRGEERRRGPT